MLYIVPTPIGNLGDITMRAIEILKQVDIIACEDTRTSGTLLSHYAVETPKVSYHEHNEKQRTTQLIEKLQAGESVALISDAGMPLVSDPGYRLVQAAIENDLPLTVLPGPSSVMTALAGSGLPTDRFVFEGFLPAKKGKQTKLEAIAARPETTVAFESPHRIIKTLRMLQPLCEEDRRVVVARELSKKFEEYVRGTIEEVITSLESQSRVRGEIVLLVAGSPKKTRKRDSGRGSDLP